MKPLPVDGVTYRDTVRALAMAREKGLDPVEELNRVGLLLTQARHKSIKLGAMRFIAEHLDGWAPHEFLRRLVRPDHPATPADMYHCIHGWIMDLIEAVEEE